LKETKRIQEEDLTRAIMEISVMLAVTTHVQLCG